MESNIAETRFGLIRHAQTEWNRERRIQGQKDSPLTLQGMQDARRWGKRLGRFGWDRMVCSDLGRSRQTASFINEALGLPICHEFRLREQDWGEWAGKTAAEIRRENPDLVKHLERSGWGFQPPDGESREAVWQRARAALQDAANGFTGENILVVTHEGIIKCLVYRLLGRAFVSGEPLLLAPLHMHWITIGVPNAWRLSLNAVALNEDDQATAGK